LIALTFNQSKNNLQFVVTTHSPYVLTALNNLLQAGLLYESLDGDRLLSLQTVMPQFKTLEPKDISAYAFMAGGCSTIVEPETGLIDASIIDSVSDILAIEFDALIGID
jgi:predicted ATP-binding protein involved in virulence